MSEAIDWLEYWINGELVWKEVHQMAVLFVIAYLFGKMSPVFRLLVKNQLQKRDLALLFGLFSTLSVMGTILATKVPLGTHEDAWALLNTRSSGAVLAGFLGGPGLGLAVGFTSGLYRYSLGGITAGACFIGTTYAGLIAGLVYTFILKHRPGQRFNWAIALVTSCTVELINKALVYGAVRELDSGMALISEITVPMLIGNGLGVALFVSILNDYYCLLSERKVAAHAEDDRLRARVDPHFLANALTTISAITRKDSHRAQSLLRKLGSLMRERVDLDKPVSTLEHELALLNDYIAIEKARYGDKLEVNIEVEPSLRNALIPAFILQLLVENAIKHGVRHLLDTGVIRIAAYPASNGLIQIEVTDNAGLYCEEKVSQGGHGMKLVDELIQTEFQSNQFGIRVDCEADERTTVTVLMPFKVE
ncbi:MAG: LytS/YhcK type 5TM receptor domain-containing protein [Methylococcaceae bacterium]